MVMVKAKERNHLPALLYSSAGGEWGSLLWSLVFAFWRIICSGEFGGIKYKVSEGFVGVIIYVSKTSIASELS